MLPLPRAQFRQIGSREHQQPAFRIDRRNQRLAGKFSTSHRRRNQHVAALGYPQAGLAGPVARLQFTELHKKSVARVAGQQPAHRRITDQHATKTGTGGRVEPAGQRLALTARRWQRMGRQTIGAPGTVEEYGRLRALAERGSQIAVAGLVAEAAGSISWPLAARTQPPTDSTTVTGSLLTSAVSASAWAASRSTMAVRRLSPCFSASASNSSRISVFELCSALEHLIEPVPLFCQRLLLAADLDFLQPGQLAQAQVEDRFSLDIADREALHQHLLGLVLPADDADHFVDIEESNQQAIEDVQPVLDLARAGPAGAA